MRRRRHTSSNGFTSSAQAPLAATSRLTGWYFRGRRTRGRACRFSNRRRRACSSATIPSFSTGTGSPQALATRRTATRTLVDVLSVLFGKLGDLHRPPFRQAALAPTVTGRKRDVELAGEPAPAPVLPHRPLQVDGALFHGPPPVQLPLITGNRTLPVVATQGKLQAQFTV